MFEREKRMSQAKRLAGMLRLSFLLCSERGLDVAQFAEDQGVCRRTVYRWLDAAEEAGLLYCRDQRGVVRSQPGCRPQDLFQ